MRSMGSLPYDLRPHLLGGGQIVPIEAPSFRLELPGRLGAYADAQVDDGKGRRRSQFHWAPPTTVTLRARASHPAPPGTLGFGLWNDPFGVSLGGAGGAQKLPAAPQAAWFFYGAPPNDFTFVHGGASHGWKAACLQSAPIPPALLLAGGAAALVLSRVGLFRGLVVRRVKAIVSATEAVIPAPLEEWHRYRLEWRPEGVRFDLDGERVLATSISPRGPLCFVAWIDNQYAVLSEQQGIRFGVVPTTAPAWLEIADLEFHRGPVAG